MYCDNHFIIYVNQIIMLYTLNVYSAVSQLYLNKSGRKKKTKKPPLSKNLLVLSDFLIQFGFIT